MKADNPEPLFLDAAVQANRLKLRGGVTLNLSKRSIYATVCLLICFIAIIAIAITGKYTRYENVKGVLQTDVQASKVVALRPGVLIALNVSEGQTVSAGQRLAIIRVDLAALNGRSAFGDQLSSLTSQQALTTAQAVASHARASSERENSIATLESSRRQILELKAQIDLQRSMVNSLGEAYARYEPLVSRGFVTRSDMDKRFQELLAAKQNLSQLSQRMADVEADAARAVAQMHQSRAEEQGAVLSAANSAELLKIQRYQIVNEQVYAITAPINGIVTGLQAGLGRTVDATHPLMTIVPLAAKLHAELYAPSKAIGFVQPGQAVRLLYDAFPFDHFGSFSGTVQNVSKVGLDPRDLNTAVEGSALVYRIDVSLTRQTIEAYGRKTKLQPGMSLSANVILERRSFGSWLFEPINAIRKRDQ